MLRQGREREPALPASKSKEGLGLLFNSLPAEKPGYPRLVGGHILKVHHNNTVCSEVVGTLVSAEEQVGNWSWSPRRVTTVSFHLSDHRSHCLFAGTTTLRSFLSLCKGQLIKRDGNLSQIRKCQKFLNLVRFIAALPTHGTVIKTRH